MRHAKSNCRVLSAVLAVVMGLVMGAAQAEPDSAGKVTYLKGKVEAQRKGSWVNLGQDASVFPGDTVRTEKKGRVEIRLADSSVIRLGSASLVVINEAVFRGGGEKKFSAKMMQGQAYAVVSKLVGSDSNFEVRTNNAVAGVRGTTFRINAQLDKSTVVRVYTGAVAVSNAPIFAKAGKPKDKGEAPAVGGEAKAAGGEPKADEAPKAADEPQGTEVAKATLPKASGAATASGAAKEGKFQMPGPKSVKPDRGGRAEVAGPQEVTKRQWEEFVAKAMQEVRVAADGKMAAPVSFDPGQDAADEWVSWNQARDKDQEKADSKP